jgi:hypothetical protein
MGTAIAVSVVNGCMFAPESENLLATEFTENTENCKNSGALDLVFLCELCALCGYVFEIKYLNLFNYFTNIRQVALDRCRGRHRRAEQMGASTRPLPIAKIAIRSRCATLTRLQVVAIDGGAE